MSKDLIVVIIDMLAGTKNLLEANERESVINAVIDLLDREVKND